MRREGAVRKNASRAVMYIFLIAASLISVFPLYWSFISAFNNTQQILGGWMLPSTHLFENLQHLFEQHNVMRALKNSFATTILQTVLALAVSSIAGYGFEIYHDKAKDTVMVILMLAMMVPFVAAATITFMNAWNAYLWPKVIMQTNEAITMPMLVANTMGGYVIDYGVVMAAVTICSLPTVIIFFCLQKSFTNAVAGAVK